VSQRDADSDLLPAAPGGLNMVGKTSRLTAPKWHSLHTTPSSYRSSYKEKADLLL
jgi:hypothetical protein